MDEQHEGDKVLHQDSVEDVVREVLRDSGVSGAVIRVVISEPINFDTVGIQDGVTIYTPVIGDQLFDAWPIVIEGFDGTTPLADIGLAFTFTDSGGGFYYYGDGALDVSAADPPEGAGNSFPGLSGGRSGWRLMEHFPTYRAQRFLSTDPLLAVVSQDGNKGGDPVGGVAGSLRWVMLIIPAVP